MVAKPLIPLSTQVEIVDEFGKPTPQFCRVLQKLAIGTSLTQTASGTLDLAAIAAKTILANKTAGSASPTACTITEILDFITGTPAQGDILFRGSSAWSRLAAGTAGKVLQTNGAGADPTWVTPAAGGGSRSLITEVVTTGSATNVSFTSIVNSYRDLEVRVRGRGTKAAGNCTVQIRMNGDTGANYDRLDMEDTSAATTRGSVVAGNQISIGYLPGSTAPANVGDLVIAHIGDYRGTIFQKAVIAQSSLKTANSAGNMFVMTTSGWWRNTAAITQIDVFPDTNGFVDGTVVSLYGTT